MKRRSLLATVTAVAAFFATATLTAAQTSDDIMLPSDSSGASYHVSPDSTSLPASAPDVDANSTTDQNAGPVRLARFSLVQGDVSWRPSETDNWSTAALNIPLREGAQIWVTNGGKAEVQFDDGSYIRVGAGAVLSLQTLYSDERGEFTELKLSQGLLSMDLDNPSSIYQIETPVTSIKATGSSQVRIGVSDGVEVAVREGSASLTGPGGTAKLIAGNYTYLADDTAQYSIGPIPSEDSWDRWNDRREAALDDEQTQEHCPSNIAVCAGDLDDYGIWREDPQYGWVWCPKVVDASWCPYECGSWTYVEPFGWTWCSTEPWGWAPYHYGAWFHAAYGWGWRPGPARQYWSPAVVSFSEHNGEIAWCALSPGEVDYSALNFASDNSGFFLGFSIGQTGCYYPTAAGYCVGRPFNNDYVNGFGRPGFRAESHIDQNERIDGHFIPKNARYNGVVSATAENFGRGDRYRSSNSAGAELFSQGHVIGSPDGKFHTFSGPADIQVGAASWSPTKSIEPNRTLPEAVRDRPFVYSQVPTSVSRELGGPAVHANWLDSDSTSRETGVVENHFDDSGMSSAQRANSARSDFDAGPIQSRSENSEIKNDGGGTIAGGVRHEGPIYLNLAPPRSDERFQPTQTENSIHNSAESYPSQDNSPGVARWGIARGGSNESAPSNMDRQADTGGSRSPDNSASKSNTADSGGGGSSRSSGGSSNSQSGGGHWGRTP